MSEGGWNSGTWGQAGWGMSAYIRSVAELATGDVLVSTAQTHATAVVETSAATSDQVVSGSIFNSQAAEAVEASQVISATVNFVSSVNELTQLTDTTTALVDFSTSVSEAAVTQEQVSGVMIFASSLAESATAESALSNGFSFEILMEESVVADENTIGTIDLSALVSEAGSALSSMDGPVDFFTFFADNVLVRTQNVVAPSIFSAIIGEAVNVSDPLSARFFWEPVPDAQDITWVEVPTTLP